MKDEKNRILLSGRKIDEVRYFKEPGVFSGVSFNNYAYFPNTFEWKPNPGLSIITGVNGAGKSQLLKFLYQKLENDYSTLDDITRHHRRVTNIQSRDAPGVPESFESENLNVQYVPHNFMPKGIAGPTKDIGSAFIEDLDRNDSGLKYLLSNHLENKTKNTPLAITNFVTWGNSPGKDFLNTIVEKILKTPNYQNLTEEEIINKAKIYAMEQPTHIQLIATDFTLSFFISSFEAYKNLKDNIRKHNYDYETLLNFYLKKNDIENESVIAISELQRVFQGDNIESYKTERLSELWGSNTTPWDAVNQQLKRLCPSFKHKLIYSTNIYFAPKGKEVKDLRECYGFEQLSSGEQMILTVLSWQYCQSNFSFTNDMNRKNIFKSDLILLDEPDKHFDPKLSKIFYQIVRDVLVEELGIQVIMTTHRLDTIALSNEGEVFTISKNEYNNIEIAKSHKLLAMFRLTSNLREFTNHHHKVYTESRNDALFYEGVYKTLMQYCNDLRENKEIAAWQPPESILDDILSRRFQLSFTSVSDNGDAGGNCAKVIDYIAKDITAYRNLERDLLSTKFYDRLELCSPYGIVDNDYDKEYDFSKIHNAEGKTHQRELQDSVDNIERVIILKRHSLENYICDPFILCSFLDNIQHDLPVDINNSLIELKNAVDNNISEAIQDKAKEFFRLLLLRLPHIKHKLDKGSLVGKEKEVYERTVEDICILEKNENQHLIDSIYDVVQEIMIDKNIIKIHYPKELLEIKGHVIAEALFSKDKKKAKNATYVIAAKICQNGIEYIPLDLAKTIFELNKNVMTHVREVLKPGKQKLKWSEKLSYYNSKANCYPSANIPQSEYYPSICTKRTRESQEEIDLDVKNKTSKQSAGISSDMDQEYKEQDGIRYYDCFDQANQNTSENQSILLSIQTLAPPNYIESTTLSTTQHHTDLTPEINIPDQLSSSTAQTASWQQRVDQNDVQNDAGRWKNQV